MGIRCSYRNRSGGALWLVAVLVAFAGNLNASAAYELYLRCYDKYLDKVLCEEGSQIDVHAAFYADHGVVISCHDSDIPSGLCTADISQISPEYYKEILTKCNGYRSCVSLKARKEKTSCNKWFNPKTDYVLLEYLCVPVRTTSPSTTPTTVVSTTTAQSWFSSTDADSSTVSGNVSLAHNGSYQASAVTVPNPNQNPVQGSSMLALKIALPLLLIILAIAAVLVMLFLLKKRKKNARSSEQTSCVNGAAQSRPQNWMVFSNATYETASTLPIRQDDNTNSNHVYQQAATVRLSEVSQEDMPSATSTMENRPLPTVGRPANTYIDMSFSQRSANKLKAWFRNQTSKKSPRNAPTEPAVEPAAEETQPEAIYAEPGEPRGADSRNESLTHQGHCASSSCSSPAMIQENHYAVSPVVQKMQPNSDYMAMDDSPTGSKGRASVSDASEHYSEIEPPVRLQDIEGVYLSPTNNAKVLPSTHDTAESKKEAEKMYENVETETKPRPQPSSNNNNSNESVFSEQKTNVSHV